jgi:hypothetical protein
MPLGSGRADSFCSLSTQQQHNTHMHKNNLSAAYTLGSAATAPVVYTVIYKGDGGEFCVVFFFSTDERRTQPRPQQQNTGARCVLGEAQKRAGDEKRREEISSREKRGRAKYGESPLPSRAQGDQSNYRQSLY